jgi:RNA recognition motif-containing protein
MNSTPYQTHYLADSFVFSQWCYGHLHLLELFPQAPRSFHSVSANNQLTTCRIYIKNLEERVNIDSLTSTLRTLFKPFGNILDIVAKRSIGRRGQAFVVFDNVESATRALEEIQGFPLWDKPIVLEYARSKSDALVVATDESKLEQHKRARLAEKGKALLYVVGLY